MKAKKIASLACAFLLACSACPVSVSARNDNLIDYRLVYDKDTGTLYYRCEDLSTSEVFAYDFIDDGYSFIGYDDPSIDYPVYYSRVPEFYAKEVDGFTYFLKVYEYSYDELSDEISEYYKDCDIIQTVNLFVMKDGVTYHQFSKYSFDDNDEFLGYEFYYGVESINDASITQESILSSINGDTVYCGDKRYEELCRWFYEIQACKEKFENSDIMTLEDEIEIPTVKGDATGDGEVDITDVIFANKAVLGQKQLNDEQTKALDIDGNGIVDATDSLTMMKYIVGLIETL